MSTPSGDRVPVWDLIWRLPVMAFCMWLAMANYTSVSMASPLWVNAPLLLSGLWWNFLAGMMVSMKATVTIGGND